MMELPSAGLAKNIGLTARTFRSKAGPDLGDRSVWTDTPADRERKEKVSKTCMKFYYLCLQWFKIMSQF